MRNEIAGIALGILFILITPSMGKDSAGRENVEDPRNIDSGYVIPDEGYCDQPYVVITKDGTLYTSPAMEHIIHWKQGIEHQHLVP